MPFDEYDQKPKMKIMTDDELLQIAIERTLDKCVENLQSIIKTWIKNEYDGNYPDGMTPPERFRKLTDNIRSVCDGIDKYAEKLDENISKQANGE